MKYFIAFAGITSVVSAIGVTTVNPKCNFDYCLRNVIASNLPTRPGYADCTSFLLTTVTPAPTTTTEYYNTIETVTDPSTMIITTTIAFPAESELRRRRGMEYLKAAGRFKKIVRRDDPEPVPGTAITVTNTMPDYMVKSCTQLGSTLATDRYSSACSCVGAINTVASTVAVPTVVITVTTADPSVTVTVTPTSTLTAYSLVAQISSAPAALNGKYLATSVLNTAGTLLVPTATAAAGALAILIKPDGKTTIGGKLVAAKVSSLSSDVRYLVLIADTTIPAGTTAVSCQIGLDSIITCSTDETFDRWILHTGSTNSLRLLKQGAAKPAPAADYHLGNFLIKAVSPA